MQDSLEDYIKFCGSNKSTEPTEFDNIRVTGQRKKESDMRAMKIVEFSIEGKLRPEILVRCLPYINQSHYQDIVEERAITKLCGYSLCGKRIPEMPKKQYYIACKSNKVYDITDRKNYCSNFCYKASLHIKKQIDNTPLWLRKLEDIPEYQILGPNDGGLPGEYVDQGIVKPVVDSSFTPVSIFTKASLEDLVDNQKETKQVIPRGSHKRLSKLHKTTMQTINENAEHTEEETTIPCKDRLEMNADKTRKRYEHISSTAALPVIDENEEKPETTSSLKEYSDTNVKTNTKKTKRKSSKVPKSDIESLIKKVLKEWLTLETYIFVYGESTIKEVLSEKKLGDYFETLNVPELRVDQQTKYMDICRRLQLQEMADDKFDTAIIGDKKLKPLPDYRKLKEESGEINIKVKCFYGGELHEKEDTNFPTSTSKKNGDTAKDEEPPAVLPLVDVHSQNAMRRKIFLTSINKSLHQLLLGLGIKSLTSVLSDIQSLVKTFKLRADNIVFKPVVWNCIAVVLLYILSIKDKNIKNILEEKSSREYIELQLWSLPSKLDFINCIITGFQNIDAFVESYISSN